MKEPDIEGIGWTRPLEVCTIQPVLALGDVDSNLSRAEELVRSSTKEGPVDLFVLPEVFTTGFPYDRLPELSKRSGEVLGCLSDIAEDLGSHLMFTQVVKESGSYYNRCFVLGTDGKEVTSFDKTHLFFRADEHLFFDKGDHLVHFDIHGARIAPLICYELRFPELSRRLVLEGSHILVYMGQWPRFRTFQWDALLMARAIENQCYVVASGSYGDHGDHRMGGHSRLISPFGNILGNVQDGGGYARATLDPKELIKFRKSIPVLKERRPDLY
ncbi:MAG: nitrilase-related carbon-nitrogen hydrolase [Thermoplasmatota archaeon]